MAKKLVLTGGPSGGKTTLAMALSRAFGNQVVMMPESASLLFQGGFRRVEYPSGVKHQQKAIYHVQVEHEAIYSEEFADRLIICDRGTLDGVAYWPNGEDEYFQVVGSSRKKELERYDWVLHLDTAGGNGYNAKLNPHRTEDFEEAIQLNHKILEVWRGHPQRFIIPSTSTFLTKMGIAIDIVDHILKGCEYGEVCQKVQIF